MCIILAILFLYARINLLKMNLTIPYDACVRIYDINNFDLIRLEVIKKYNKKLNRIIIF